MHKLHILLISLFLEYLEEDTKCRLWKLYLRARTLFILQSFLRFVGELTECRMLMWCRDNFKLLRQAIRSLSFGDKLVLISDYWMLFVVSLLNSFLMMTMYCIYGLQIRKFADLWFAKLKCGPLPWPKFSTFLFQHLRYLQLVHRFLQEKSYTEFIFISSFPQPRQRVE